jgi:hypothetical protein
MLSVVRDRCSFHRRKIVALSCVLATWLGVAVPASAAVITFEAPTDVTQGQSFGVDFVLGQFVGSLVQFKFTILFDSSALGFSSVSLGDVSDSFFSPLPPVEFVPESLLDSAGEGDVDLPNADMAIRDNLAFPTPPVTGSPVLLHASFLALSSGQTTIYALFETTQDDGLFDDGGQNQIFGPDAVLGEFLAFPRSVNVVAPPATVPEPGTLLLLSTGIAASFASSRRRTRQGPTAGH